MASLRQRLRELAAVRRRFGYRRLLDPAAPRRTTSEPQEDPAALHRGASSGASSQGPQTGARYAVSHDDASTARTNAGRWTLSATRSSIAVASACWPWSMTSPASALPWWRTPRCRVRVSARELDRHHRQARQTGDDCQRQRHRAHQHGHPAMVASSDVEWHYIAPGKPQQNAFIESLQWPPAR